MLPSTKVFPFVEIQQEASGTVLETPTLHSHAESAHAVGAFAVEDFCLDDRVGEGLECEDPVVSSQDGPMEFRVPVRLMTFQQHGIFR